MATSPETMNYIMDQLSSLPSVRFRAMFGGHAIYCDEKVVALVGDDQLFLKITPAGLDLLGEDHETAPAYTGAKPSFLVDADTLDDHERLSALVRATADALPAPKPKKPRKAKKK